MSKFNAESLRVKHNCPELYVLEKIPDEDIASGRHNLAECHGEMYCSNPLRYKMVVLASAGPDDDFLDTYYYCEEHKEEC